MDLQTATPGTDSTPNPGEMIQSQLSSLEKQLDAITSRYNTNKTDWSQDTFNNISNNHRINAIDEYMKFLVGTKKVTESQPSGQVVLPDTSDWPAEGLFSRVMDAVKDYSQDFFTKNPSGKEFLAPDKLVGRLEKSIQKFDTFLSGLGNVGYGYTGQVKISKDKAIKGEADAIAEGIYYFLMAETFDADSLPNISKKGTFGSGYIGSIESILSDANSALSALNNYSAEKKEDGSWGEAIGISLLTFIATGAIVYFGINALLSRTSPQPTQEPTPIVTEAPTPLPPTQILPTPTPADVLIPLTIQCNGKEEQVPDAPNIYACGNAVDGNIAGSAYATNDFNVYLKGIVYPPGTILEGDNNIDITLRLSRLIPIKDAELRLHWGRDMPSKYDITIFDSTATELGSVRVAPGEDIGFLDTHPAPYENRILLGEAFRGLGSEALDKDLYSIVISPVIAPNFFDPDTQDIVYGNSIALYEGQVVDISPNR